MIGRVLFVILVATLLLLLSAVSVPVALGDDPGEIRLRLPAPVSSRELDADDSLVVLPELSSDSASPPIQLPSLEDEVHWLVSIRHCSGLCRKCHGLCVDFDVYRSNCHGLPTPSSEAEMRAALIPGVPICIVVHGSFVPPEDVPQESRNTVAWLRNAAPHLPVQFVFLTWPSEGILTLSPGIATTSPLPGLDVAVLGRRAEMNGMRLARLVQSMPSESPVCLIGHSHGARMVASSLNLLGGGHLDGMRLPPSHSRRIRTVLVAAAIDHDWLVPGQRYDRALCATESLLSLRSERDWALMLYPLRRPFSRRALGRAGFSQTDLQRLGPLSEKVAEVDVTPIVGQGHVWPAFYENPPIAQALVPWVYFTE